MRQVFPSAGPDLDDEALAALYAFPAGAGPSGAAWVRANMVASADGAAEASGQSAGLSSAGDRRLFAVLRGLADVIVAGAGTVRAEKYQPVRPREVWSSLRSGRPPVPPIAVVSGQLDLDPSSSLFTSAPADARTIVITCSSSPADRRAALTAASADVIVAGSSSVDLKDALEALRSRGLSHVSCEGGPHLLGDLGAAGLLDELCLTIGPLLAGPGAGRVTAGAPWPPGLMRQMGLAHVLEEDSFLFTRYTRP
jgi:riboflavin biosynthesis pyrimidine reductase